MLLDDFLTVLGVPHTVAYTQQRQSSMPFQSLFGIAKLLQEYGVPTQGLKLTGAEQLAELEAPFIAGTTHGLVIVTAITPDTISYLSQGEPEQMALADFAKVFSGVVLVAMPTAKSREPDYASHRRDYLVGVGKKWVWMASLLALAAYLWITGGQWKYISLWLVLIIDLAGLTLTTMLVQKTLRIKNRAADRVCGVLQEGGCDSVLETKASKFFGIFSWSEVGLGYFGVSLLTLLVFPQYVGYLAACLVCCLPFTVWSIWYQKFRAKAWCTLCVSVQTSLWLLFFTYWGGGWLRDIFPLRIEFWVLGVSYLAAVLSLNRLMPLLGGSGQKQLNDENSNSDKITRA